MKKFESNLKTLIDATEGGCKTIPLDKSGMPEADARYLSARGFVKLISAGNNEFEIAVLPSGLIYFDLKADAAKLRWLDRIEGFFFGMVSTVVSGLFLQWLILQWLQV